jgi:hypothetical protein
MCSLWSADPPYSGHLSPMRRSRVLQPALMASAAAKWEWRKVSSAWGRRAEAAREGGFGLGSRVFRFRTRPPNLGSVVYLSTTKKTGEKKWYVVLPYVRPRPRASARTRTPVGPTIPPLAFPTPRTRLSHLPSPPSSPASDPPPPHLPPTNPNPSPSSSLGAHPRPTATVAAPAGGPASSRPPPPSRAEKIGDLPSLGAGFAGLPLNKSASLSCPPQLIWLRSFALWRIFIQIHLDFEPN